MTTQSETPNIKRVLAGRRNHALRKGLSPEGRERLRESTLAHKPWLQSTGPKTAEGKARSAANGKLRQKGPRSVREIRADLKELHDLLQTMQAARQLGDAEITQHD